MTAGAIRPQTQIYLAMAVSALMMAHQVAGKAARDGLFLSQFDTSMLPRMVAGAAFVAVVSSICRGRTLVRLGPLRITAVSFAVSGVLQVAEWELLRYSPRLAACVIYLHIVAFGAILLSGFWSLMNESFDPRSAKGLFGKLGGMGTLGGVAGGLLAERVAALVSSAAVVLLLAVLHLACAVLLWRAFPVGAAGNVNSVAPAGGTTVTEAMRRYPFLLTLAGVVLAASIGTALLDFVFKTQAAQTIGRGAPLLRFFGLYYTATSVLVFAVQSFVAKTVIERAGLAASTSALPLTIGIGSLAALLVPGFPLLSVLRGFEILMRGSIFRSAYELFYTAVAPADKRAVKSVIDVGVDRLGDAASAGLVTAFLMFAPGRFGGLLASACACSVVALVLTMRLRTGYVTALQQSLVKRGIELDPTLGEESTTQSILMASISMPHPALPSRIQPATAASPLASDSFVQVAAELRSGVAAQVIQTIEKLGPDDWTLAPLLINLLAWNPVMPAARDALRKMSPKITGMLIDVLLDPDRDFTLRRRVPRVLAAVASMRSVEGLFAALEDPRFEVRFYSARALYLLFRDHADLRISPERIWAAIKRELSQQKSVWQSHRLLDSRDSQDGDWFFDDQLHGRADRNLEHLFTMLALLLPVEAVRIAFRALHTEDRQLKGTAFEYLESATPPNTRGPLLQLLESDAAQRLAAPVPNAALARLLQSDARVAESLSLVK